jgi:hypothetical protein
MHAFNRMGEVIAQTLKGFAFEYPPRERPDAYRLALPLWCLTTQAGYLRYLRDTGYFDEEAKGRPRPESTERPVSVDSSHARPLVGISNPPNAYGLSPDVEDVSRIAQDWPHNLKPLPPLPTIGVAHELIDMILVRKMREES